MKKNEATLGQKIGALISMWLIMGGMWALGYMTGKASGELKGLETGKKLATIK